MHAYRLHCGCVGTGQPGLTTADKIVCPAYHGLMRIVGFGIAVSKLLAEVAG